MFKFNNLGDLIIYQNSNYKNPKYLNYKLDNEWISFSNQDFFNNILILANAFKNLGLKKGQKFANYSYQNPIWLIVDFAIMLNGAISVPIFNNISEDNLFFELDDAKVDFIFVDNHEICKKISDKFPKIKIITKGFNYTNSTSYEDLFINKNNNSNEDINFFTKNIDTSDIATIVYSSGTSGFPKGVEISHKALISQINDSQKLFNFKENYVILSYLPLAHIFERMVMMFYLAVGANIYFVNDIKKLSNFLTEVAPQAFTSVPRALEKIYNKINQSSNNQGFLKNKILKIAIKRAFKLDCFRRKNFIDKFFDKIVYKKFREKLGNKVDMIICGGSALSLDLQNFYWNVGIKIYCGYGLTECSPVIASNAPNQFKLGTVGKAFPSVSIKIDNDHELLAKGPNIMTQYHNNNAKTQEIFLEGWLKTGDLASIDSEGYITIIGRKKDLFKTSNGKYVHPTKIELKLIQDINFLIGAMIIAEARPFVSVLLFIDYELIDNFKVNLGFKGTNHDFIESKILHNYIENKINIINKKLDHWENIVKFVIIKDEISIASGEITPSLKLIRTVIEKKFKLEIEKIYKE